MTDREETLWSQNERREADLRGLARIREELRRRGIIVPDPRTLAKPMPEGREPGSDDE